MMAMFFAQRVILGKTTFAHVPEKLKAQVRELLVDAGLPELAQEYTYGAGRLHCPYFDMTKSSTTERRGHERHHVRGLPLL